MDTAYRMERTRQLTSEGMSATDIADILGVTPDTVARYRRRMGLTSRSVHRPVSSDLIERMRLMVEDGASHREIARTLGVHPKTVSKRFPGTGWSYQQSGSWRWVS